MRDDEEEVAEARLGAPEEVEEACDEFAMVKLLLLLRGPPGDKDKEDSFAASFARFPMLLVI